MEKMIDNILLCTFITVASYLMGVMVFQKFKKAWLNPLYTCTVFIICVLTLFHLNFTGYTSGTDLFSLLMGTATVSLAVPLYKQFALIKKNFFIIVCAVMTGTLTGVASIVLLTKVLHMNQEMMISMIPKSVTAPIALSISQSLGGIPSLTVSFVFVSAIFSLAIGPGLLKYTRIKSKVAKGLALGTSAQAIGAKRAFDWGEVEGAMGSIAMITAALCMSLIAPFLIYFYL
ncbi:LrgB family protein [Paenibacillus sp. BSR1-1]|uniref:LrgB family protein n=1 Tax=Paenibacillus sp. BSR1-1 TaxID=3020845 RepID=UPI0025AFB048|nr:LrgB family protein [Paenibacillus sp. BSR1-1]MDN3016340.1 LrgB family protein [Paenibacillus sp. BSR1-1]